jgi:hypothetical protein
MALDVDVDVDVANSVSHRAAYPDRFADIAVEIPLK